MDQNDSLLTQSCCFFKHFFFHFPTRFPCLSLPLPLLAAQLRRSQGLTQRLHLGAMLALTPWARACDGCSPLSCTNLYTPHK